MLELLGFRRTLKGYKVTNAARNKKYGIAANSLKMLKEKARAKFNLNECRIYMAKDGSEVLDEDYFNVIEPQTLFVVAESSEVIKTDFELMYEAIRSRNGSIIKVADLFKVFLTENREVINQLVKEFDENAAEENHKIQCSLKEEHLEWFQGQDLQCKTKEEAMQRRAQDRIKGYFYKTKEEITKHELYRTNSDAKHIFDKVLDTFKYLLISCDHFYMIFDRKYKKKHAILNDHVDSGQRPSKRTKLHLKMFAENKKLFDEFRVSLCTEYGEFFCQGLWNENCCRYNSHTINPYSNRDNLVLFQLWNLDHQIEITRSVIPSLIANVELLVLGDSSIKCTVHNRQAVDLSVLSYFLELFTLENLKLVHIVCHDKASHQLKSKGTLICEKCEEHKLIKDLLENIPT